MRIVPFAQLVESRWKNGGGITREIAEERHSGTLIWRLSMADVVTDGAFSDFSGLTRILTVIDGVGMELSGPDTALDADYAKPVIFDGETPIMSTLKDGPIRDLNLMFDTATCSGTVEPLQGPAQIVYPTISDVMVLGVHCVAGSTQVNADIKLMKGDTALVTSTPLRLELDRDAIALVITLKALS